LKPPGRPFIVNDAEKRTKLNYEGHEEHEEKEGWKPESLKDRAS